MAEAAPTRSISTVLLDAGGVILDETEYEAVMARLVVKALAPYVPGYSVEDYEADVRQAIACFCPSVTMYVVWKHLRPDAELCGEVRAAIRAEYAEHEPLLRLMAGIGHEIRQLSRSFRVATAGQYGRSVLDLLDRHGLLDCFANHLTQDDFDITKPDPRYLERIAAAVGAHPRECVMVGDRIDKDVIPAKHLGMKTIRIRVGLHVDQEPRTPWEVPDAELDGVRGLAQAVRRLAGRLV